MPFRRKKESKPVGSGLERIALAPLADATLTVAYREKDACGVARKATCAVEIATRQNFINCHANEDQYFKGPVGYDAYGFGVMDGHDGVFAAKLASEYFLRYFEALLKSGSHIISAVENSIIQIEKLLEETSSSAGACCLFCIHSGNYLWCANLGDCRGCFCPLPPKTTGYEGEAPASSLPLIWLSRDMKATMSYEKERIENAGGCIQDGRVGGLEPTRTVGDFDVKMRVPATVISITPEIRCLDLEETGPGLAILCTDGVWDVMTSTDVDRVVTYRTPMLEANPQEPQPFLRAICSDLVAFAVARGSPDDCTAMCALVGCRT